MHPSPPEPDAERLRHAPSRFQKPGDALRQYGAKAVAYADALRQGDPLADALAEAIASDSGNGTGRAFETALTQGLDAVTDPPPALAAFFAHVEAIPEWLDRDLLAAGSVAYLRDGPALRICMTAALAAGYRSAASVKPLCRTRRFLDLAERRAGETAAWFVKSVRPGGLDPLGPGYQATVRVRLVHAMVRRAIRRSDDWDEAAWGAPLNMGDTARGIALEFTTVPIDARRQMGFTVSDDEAAAIYHLFRYIGYLLGVPETLLPCNEWQARELSSLIELTSDGPDDDCLALVGALLDIGYSNFRAQGRTVAAAVSRDLLHGYIRTFAGDALADRLRIRDTPFKHALAVLRPYIRLSDWRRRQRPGKRGLDYAASYADSMLRDIAGIDVVDARTAASPVAG